MASTTGNGSTDLYFNVAGVGSYLATVPGDLASVGGQQATKVIELAVARTYEWFIEKYMPLRFQGYARAMLGYSVAAGTMKKKANRARSLNKDAIDPNVWTGATKAAAMATRIETVATGGTTKMTVTAKARMHTPQYVDQGRNQVTRKVLSQITATEAQRMADYFFALVKDSMSQFVTETTTTKRGIIKTRVSPGQADVSQFGRSSRSTVIASRGIDRTVNLGAS